MKNTELKERTSAGPEIANKADNDFEQIKEHLVTMHLDLRDTKNKVEKLTSQIMEKDHLINLSKEQKRSDMDHYLNVLRPFNLFNTTLGGALKQLTEWGNDTNNKEEWDPVATACALEDSFKPLQESLKAWFESM